MMHDPNNPNASFGQQPQPPRQTNWLLYLGLGCGGFILLTMCLCGGGVYYAWSQAPTLVRNFIVQEIEKSEMSAEDKAKAIAQVDRAVDAYKAGKIGAKELERLQEGMEPFKSLIMVNAAEQKYIDASGLSDEEKLEGHRVLQRVARGIHDRTDIEKFEQVLNGIIVQVGENRKIPETISDAELREFLQECKDVADEVGVPDEPFEVNFPDEIERLMDEVLGETEP
ncbi:MAG: hypothetical protein N2C14_25935 [Planctomycetales bacterium]